MPIQPGGVTALPPTQPAHMPPNLEEHMLCPAWNSATRCGKQKACPHGKFHACSFRLPSGSLCGNAHHGKAHCRHNPAARTFWSGARPTTAKGGGKTKGKGAGRGRGRGKGGGKNKPPSAPSGSGYLTHDGNGFWQ